MSAAADVTGRSLLGRAFFNQTNLILLGGAALFALALESLWPLVAGLVAEGIWLLLAGQSRGLRRKVGEEMAARAREQGAALRTSLVAGLDAAHGSRVRALESMVGEIRRLAAERGLDPLVLDRPERGLDALLLAYVRLAGLHERLSRAQGADTTHPLEQESARVMASLAEEKDPSVRLSLRQALAMVQRRLKHHEQLDIQRRALGIKMSTLEMSFDHLRSHIWSGSAPAEVEAELVELHAGLNFLPAAEEEVAGAMARLSSPITRITGINLPIKPEGP